MRTDRPLRRALALLATLALAGCARTAGPPAIAQGTPCAGCGMGIEDLRFAGETAAAGRWSAYDDLGCLRRALGHAGGARVFLPDNDTRTLHAADSMWVVQGSFPTPMGSGAASFLDRAAAAQVAEATGGRVVSARAWLAEGSAR